MTKQANTSSNNKLLKIAESWPHVLGNRTHGRNFSCLPDLKKCFLDLNLKFSELKDMFISQSTNWSLGGPDKEERTQPIGCGLLLLWPLGIRSDPVTLKCGVMADIWEKLILRISYWRKENATVN